MAPVVSIRITRFLFSTLSLLSIFGVIETILARGVLLSETPVVQSVTHYGYLLIICLYVIWVLARLVQFGWRPRPLVPDLFFAAILIAMVFPAYLGGSIVSFRMVFSLLAAVFRTSGVTALFKVIQLNPARLLLLSFFGGIMAGMFLLMLPAATTDRLGANFHDALFTSASAVCVTGLAVKDTGTYFSGFGQGIILLLVQVGGLGIMTFSTLFTILLGKRLGWRHEEQMREIMESPTAPQMYRLIVSIITTTLVLEFIGSTFLYLRFLTEMDSNQATRNAVFHSISAFCNAGFSLFPDNMMRYAGDVYVNMVIGTLIILGGLGFVVIDDVRGNIRNFNPLTLHWSRLTVHSRIVLITTASLIVAGTLAIFYLEFDNTMLHLSTVDKLVSAVFQSVTCRTAGFNTLDIGSMRDATLLVCILLMFIGASPASTGGGVKTTTLAVLLLAARAHLGSRSRVEVYRRSISPETVYKSIAILIFGFSFIFIVTILLLSTQAFSFMQILFEAVSAFGTVGLSTGITPRLNPTGEVLLSLLMYIGRVGPLTIALALGMRRKATIEYPSTRIVVG